MTSGSQTEDQLVEFNAREAGDIQICVCLYVCSLCEAFRGFGAISCVCMCVRTHMCV